MLPTFRTDFASIRLVRPLRRCQQMREIMHESSLENFCDWVRLIQSEFAEMPGLHLSKRQAQRLWNLDAPSADAIFGALEASKFLRRMPNDVYIRADVGR
jgi:hypothetical protein